MSKVEFKDPERKRDRDKNKLAKHQKLLQRLQSVKMEDSVK